MKKAIILFIALLLLSGCTMKTASTDDNMSTRVGQILTQEYTPPAITVEPTSILEESTPEVVIIITPTPTPTVLIAEASPTPEPTLEPTQEPTPEATPEATEEEAAEETETVTETPSDTPEATQAAASDPRQKLGKAVSSDPMDDREMWNWPVGTQEYTSLGFKDGYMELTGLKTMAGWRLPMVPALTDMYVEMTVKTGKCTQDDNYGIIFHIPVFNQPDRGYLFSVSCDGFYRFTKWDGKAGTSGKGWRLVDWTANEHINTGTGAVNRIGVMAKGNRFYLYANGYLMNEDVTIADSDNPYTKGHIGVFVTAKQTEKFTIYIDEMSYWDSAFEP